MFTTYFSSAQVSVFIFFALLQLSSIYFFSIKKNIKYSLVLLFAGGLVLRLLMISFDDFLHVWDEQYHALVAKNIAENPLKPMLFKMASLKYDYTRWIANHIWLHKQPLFLWQMAFCIKLFGNSVFALRLPGAIMFSLLILVIFRMGKLLVNARSGYVAAFLFSVNNYLLEFVTGIEHTDHNDMTFIFYVALSFWAFTEYSVRKKKQYVWLTGIFSGLAILNKWLVGLIIFSGWAVSIFFIEGKAGKTAEIKNIFRALLACLLVSLPWQLYILSAFPIESSYEFSLNTRHFFEAVEGHGGNYFYHFEQAGLHYGEIIAYLLPLALFILFRDVKNIQARAGFITCVIGIYFFYTIAQTKMPAFCLIAAPIMFLALGNLFYKIVLFSMNEKTLRYTEFALLFFIGIAFLDIDVIQRNHTDWITKGSRYIERGAYIRATGFAKSLKEKYDEDKTVIFNCRPYENIPVMFFAGYTAYDRMPTVEEYNHLKKNGYKIFFVDNYDSSLPDSILNDREVILLTKEKSIREIHLKAYNGKFICADESQNAVIANRDKADAWETFSLLVLHSNECLLRTQKKQYFSVELAQNAEIIANRQQANEWEIFKLIELGNDRVAFKAFNGKYLGADEKSGKLYANVNEIGERETFKIVEK